MEYLFLLPTILALSPLIVAFRHTRGLVSQDVAIYVFRLLSLAWLWMMCALILYYWRPSLRGRDSFITNLLRATCLGCMAMAPIALTSLAITNKYQVDVLLYSGFERGAAWFALLTCMLVNVGCLALSTRYPPTSLRESLWVLLSGALLFVLAVWVLWLL